MRLARGQRPNSISMGAALMAALYYIHDLLCGSFSARLPRDLLGGRYHAKKPILK